MLPPQPGGVAAALAAAPEADVVWVAHTGLDHLLTVADVWRELPIDKPRRCGAGACRRRGAGRVDEQVEWLYDWWERIDAWVDATRRISAGRPGPPPPGT